MRKKPLILLLLPVLLTSCNPKPSGGIPQYDGYHLMWSDEFDDEELNEEYWDYMTGNGSEYGNPGWGNGELEYYRKENVYLKDSKLHIVAKRESYRNFEFTSARIRTTKKVFFKYGKIEASIALPAARGMWPAFWMLPEDYVYGGWPHSGEIDIMEANGGSTGGSTAALHYSTSTGAHTYVSQYNSLNVREGESIADFHKYGLEWEEEEIRFLVDDNVFFTVPMRTWGCGSVDKSENPYAPFDQNFHILLNVAIGGNYVNYTRPDNDFSELEMQVEYIRVYQYND